MATTDVLDFQKSKSHKMTLGSVYDLNRSLYKNVPPMAADSAQEFFNNVGMWFSSKPGNVYFMFLCRELNDYTIFHFGTTNFAQGQTELEDLVKSRGELKDIEYNHDTDSYDFWVTSVFDEEVHMYKLFMCQDFIIEI